MFTGLVQAIGTVTSFDGVRLILDCPELEAIQPGESIAVNGCCLTAVRDALEFELSAETLSRTNFRALQSGGLVNLERAMSLGERLGGHIVQGHVDGLATLQEVQTLPDSWVLSVIAPQGGQYLIEKGSVTLDGISLTVVAPRDNADGTVFEVHIIPHTWHHTTLSHRKPGDVLNIEFDVLAKHIERLSQFRR